MRLNTVPYLLMPSAAL